MKKESSLSQSSGNRSLWGKIVRVLLWVVFSFIVLLFVAHFYGLYSGSGEWKPEGEVNGIKMFSKKSPGSLLNQFKMEMILEEPIDVLISAFVDPDMCDFVGCKGELIEDFGEQIKYIKFVFKVRDPYKPREMVVKSQLTFFPNGDFLVEVDAVPDYIPLDDCCFRVTDMNNTWLFTPVGDSKFKLEYIVDQNMGGFMPYFLYNIRYPDSGYHQLGVLQNTILKADRYQTKAEFIPEWYRKALAERVDSIAVDSLGHSETQASLSSE